VVRAHGVAIVDRPVAEVFDYVLDLPSHVDWQGNVLFLDPLTQPPIGLGSQFLEVSQVLGRRFETVAEVVEFEPPFRIRYRAVDGPVQWETVYRLSDEDGSTRIEIEFTGEVGDFFGVSEAVVQSVTEREFESALANMKHILEGRDEPA
jgi:Polyketide cyclase / dehydrase and lipid transport